MIVSRRQLFSWLWRSAVALGIAYPLVIEPNRPVVQHTLVPIPGLPEAMDGMRIGLLADFHCSFFTSPADIRRSVTLLMAHRPDLITLAGDFIGPSPAYIDPCAEALTGLSAPMGIYAVLGNHDYWTDAPGVMRALQTAGITVMKNSVAPLAEGSQPAYLVGVDDISDGRPDLKSALRRLPPSAMTILLVHEPDAAYLFERYRRWIPLQLSGHSHGGQIRLPVIGAPYLPFLARRYPEGLQPVGTSGRWVYTTRGIGTTILPVRLNCPPEISILTLTQGDVNGSTGEAT